MPGLLKGCMTELLWSVVSGQLPEVTSSLGMLVVGKRDLSPLSLLKPMQVSGDESLFPT